jgi:chromosomal replication initiation ATPase DnaA
MKQDVFNQYVDRISDLFNIKKEDLFSKSKKRELVDARHLLYYLCFQRPMRINYIQKFMQENGYNIQHSSVIHGINVVTERIKTDYDYVSVVKDVQKSVFI